MRTIFCDYRFKSQNGKGPHKCTEYAVGFIVFGMHKNARSAFCKEHMERAKQISIENKWDYRVEEIN
jgi:hypothetical protein